jgi:hypothetical protein
MYGHDNMQESELYFALLQLLRIFSQSIRETSSHLEMLHDQWEERLTRRKLRKFQSRFEEMEDERYEILEGNWQTVLRHQRNVAATLLIRITQKTDDIHSLREGVRPPSPILAQKG